MGPNEVLCQHCGGSEPYPTSVPCIYPGPHSSICASVRHPTLGKPSYEQRLVAEVDLYAAGLRINTARSVGVLRYHVFPVFQRH